MKTLKILLSVVLFVLCVSAFACTWGSYTTKDGSETMTVRTMDWMIDDHPVVMGTPRGMKVRAYTGENPMEYTSKYAYIKVKSFGIATADGVNEKGLTYSILFLYQSETAPVKPELKNVAMTQYGDYILANFATVEEALKSEDINVVVDPSERILPGLTDRKEGFPLHVALSDATGDRVVIEMVDGKMKIYHGKEYCAMSNDPEYKIQLYMDMAKYQPGYSIESINRRARILYYMKDCDARGVTGKTRTLMNMEKMIQKTYAGPDELDPVANAPYPTLWSVINDLKNPSVYFKYYQSWNTVYYDFKSFDVNGKEPVELKSKTPPARDDYEIKG